MNGSTALATPLEFTVEQRKLIRDTFANGASDSEFGVLMEIAKARNLNPLKRQIWFTKRWDSMKKCEVWSPMVSIDGLRVIAERTGQYDGQDEPEYSYDKDGKLFSCKVRVYRKGISRPFCSEVFYAEFVQLTKEGSPNAMWKKMPHSQLGKCGEAVSLRKGFPEDTGGFYIPEELSSEQAERDVTPADSAPSKTADAVKAKLQKRLADGKQSAPQTIDAAPVQQPAATQNDGPSELDKAIALIREEAAAQKVNPEALEKYIAGLATIEKASAALEHYRNKRTARRMAIVDETKDALALMAGQATEQGGAT